MAHLSWIEFISVAVGFGLLLLPGAMLWQSWHPHRPAVDSWITGSGLSLAAAIYLAYLCAYVDIRAFYLVWAGLGGWAILKAWRLRSRIAISTSERHLFLLLLGVLMSRAVGTAGQLLPSGWDPSLHLMFANKIASTCQLLVNLEPFEPGATSYPLGSHCLLVILSKATHVSLHDCFRLCMVLLATLSTAQVYVLGRQLSKSRNAGLYSAATYGFVLVFGSLGYHNWGGLPNQLGMTLSLTVLALAKTLDARRHPAAIALLLVSVAFAHHHVMVALYVALLLTALWLCLRAPQFRGPLLKIAGLVLLIGGFYLIPYALQARELSQTEVLTYAESAVSASAMGWPFLALLLVCLPIYLFRARQGKVAIVEIVALVWVGVYLLGGIIYPAITESLHGERRTPFVPSRFLTDAAYLLCLPIGIAIHSCCRRVPRAWLLAALTALALANHGSWQAIANSAVPEERWQAYRWIAEHTEAETLILTDDSWTAYAAERPSLHVPRDVSIQTKGPQRFVALGQAMVQNPQAEWQGWRLVIVESPHRLNLPPHLRPEVRWQAASGLAVIELVHTP
jgi:hypothetical protein